MKSYSVILVCVLGSLLAGCGSTAGFSTLNPGITSEQATASETIRIYASKDIGRSYVELGSVAVSLHNELNGAKYIARIKEEAAKIGADAVVGFVQYGNGASGIAVKFK
ncbi:MAG: hypothetical protein KF749_07475 [Bacteroidetes bacterium]|nr:hypothetical protein [Bacteroidota bacterium]MCW5896825.1 hypothetical protein [Bacteroidota bacterium]